jgi:hypothetical protein
MARGLRAGATLTVVLALLVSGCAGFGTDGQRPTASPSLTPAPLPTAMPTPTGAPTPTAVRDVPTAAPRTTFPRAASLSVNRPTYPVGPVAPTCPTGPRQGGLRYPPVDSEPVVVNGTWSNATTAVRVAELATGHSRYGGPDPRMELAGTDYERLRVTGELVDISRRYGTEEYVLVRGVSDPTVDAVVLNSTGADWTRVVVYHVAAFC